MLAGMGMVERVTMSLTGFGVVKRQHQSWGKRLGKLSEIYPGPKPRYIVNLGVEFIFALNWKGS